jgi:dolichol-phosphate mannosyltransferase
VLWLVLVQGVPVIVLLLAALGTLPLHGTVAWSLLLVNVMLVIIRLSLLGALTGSYERRRWAYWLSPLADPLAVLRIVSSTVRRPRMWRGRSYV